MTDKNKALTRETTPPTQLSGSDTCDTVADTEVVTLQSHDATLASRSGELGTQKCKSYLVRTRSFDVLSLKPGVGQYIAIHAMLTARDFFLAYFYPSGPLTCIFSKTSPDFSCVGRG